MVSCLVTFLAPVDGIPLLLRLSAHVHPLGQIEQTFLADTALNVGLGYKFTAVLGWALAHRNFLLLKSVRVRSIGLVAFHAEGEVVTLETIEVIHHLWNRLHAAITAEP